MKKFNNWENVKAASEFVPLPAGGYIVELKNAKVKEYKNQNGDAFERFEIALDIAEGEFKDYYANDYCNQTNEDKKWKGVLRLYMPKEDGSEQDEWTKSRFKSFIEAVEDSNPGFHWDWDESKLRGKKIGCLFRLEEWEYNGKTGKKAQPFKVVSVEKIKSGNFKIPKEKLLEKNASAPTAPTPKFRDIPDEDVPF